MMSGSGAEQAELTKARLEIERMRAETEATKAALAAAAKQRGAGGVAVRGESAFWKIEGTLRGNLFEGEVSCKIMATAEWAMIKGEFGVRIPASGFVDAKTTELGNDVTGNLALSTRRLYGSYPHINIEPETRASGMRYNNNNRCPDSGEVDMKAVETAATH